VARCHCLAQQACTRDNGDYDDEIRSKDIVCKGVVFNVYGDRTCDHQGTEIRRGRHGNTEQPWIFVLLGVFQYI